MSSFSDYLLEGKMSQQFIDEFNALVKKIHHRKQSYVSLEFFQDSCWDKLLDRAKNYRSELSPAGNFHLLFISYELYRLNSRFGRESTSEIIDVCCGNEIYVATGNYDTFNCEDQNLKYDIDLCFVRVLIRWA